MGHNSFWQHGLAWWVSMVNRPTGLPPGSTTRAKTVSAYLAAHHHHNARKTIDAGLRLRARFTLEMTSAKR